MVRVAAALVLVSTVPGCIAVWRTHENTSAGSFVTDLVVVNRRLGVETCAIESHVTHVNWLMIVPTQAFVPEVDYEQVTTPKSRAIVTDSCRGELADLPPHVFPPDDLSSVPSWCVESVARWRALRTKVQQAERRRERDACLQTAEGIRQQGRQAATIADRGRLYKTIPDCDAIPLRDDLPFTQEQVTMLETMKPSCRVFTNTSPGAMEAP